MITKCYSKAKIFIFPGWTPTHLVIKNSYGNYEHDDDRWGINVSSTLFNYPTLLINFYFHHFTQGYLCLSTKYLENCAVLGSVSQLLVPAAED